MSTGRVPAAVTSEPTAPGVDEAEVGEWEPTSANTLTRTLPDGQSEAKIFGSPVNYIADGQWHEIDNNLVPSPDSDFAVENAAGTYEVSLPEDASRTPVLFETSQAWVKMKMLGLDDEAPVVSGNTATYDVQSAAAENVTYTVTDSGVKEDIQLTAAPVSPATYTYQIEASEGLVATKRPSGSIDFLDTEGRSQARIPAGVMYDSNPAGAVESSNVQFQLNDRAQGGWTLKVTPSRDWLTAPERVYPVYVDPSINQPTVRDCWIREDQPTHARCGNESVFVKVGRHAANQRVRGLIRFNTNGIPANSSISQATMNMYMNANESTSLLWADYELIRAGRAFTDQATWSSSGTASWVGGAPTGGVISSIELNGKTSGWKTWDGLESIVQGWRDGHLPNDGLILRQPDGMGVNNVLSFFSSSTQNATSGRPYISVTYAPMVTVVSETSDLEVTKPEVLGATTVNNAAAAAQPITINPHLDAGTHLKKENDGSFSIVTDQNDAFVAKVLIGDVLEADGTPVPTETEVVGNALVSTITPADSNALAYPLVLQAGSDAPAQERVDVEISPRPNPHGPSGYKRAGCKNGKNKQKYGVPLAYTFYGMEFTWRYCWTTGTENSSRIRYIEGGNSCWANFNNEVQNCMGPTWNDRRPLRYDHMSDGYFSNLYFYFQSRSCALPKVNFSCGSWTWHRVGLRAEYGGYHEYFGRY